MKKEEIVLKIMLAMLSSGKETGDRHYSELNLVNKAEKYADAFLYRFPESVHVK